MSSSNMVQSERQRNFIERETLRKMKKKRWRLQSDQKKERWGELDMQKSIDVSLVRLHFKFNYRKCAFF